MATEKMLYKSLCVYPPEVIQTSWLCRLQKKSLEHNNYLYALSVSEQNVRKLPTDNASSPKCYSKYWSNIGTICLNLILLT